MAHNIGSTSTSDHESESSESSVEINVKTLDSQIFHFRVDKNMPVQSLKEKVANASGVPPEQQRLIYRGKVLKDDQLLSQYHVEDGHTLHLVVRQPIQPQTPIGTNSVETNGTNDNRGNDAGSGTSRNRVGISRSVVLGSFNVGDQGVEGGVPDLSRIIGAVLNSIGIANQNPTGGSINLSSGIPASQGGETDATRGNAGSRSQAGNQMPSGQTFSNHPFQSLRHSLQFPLTGAAVVVPTPQMPIPDALHTLSEYINRMEVVLSATGYQPTPPVNAGDPQRPDLPSNGQGVATPEALSIILRRAQQLISGHAAAALSHIAGRLEGEGSSTNPAVRNQIQTESVQVGLAILQLGSLLLELGRTTLTLRMGQSPAESLVNAGPAVYISPSGPNSIMVQPFPLQTSSLFGGSASSQTNFGLLAPVAPADSPRNVNIHIHAVGSRANNGEHIHQEPPSGSRSGDSGSMRVVPTRNVNATAIPLQSSDTANISHPHESTQQNNQNLTASTQTSGDVASNTIEPCVGQSETSTGLDLSNTTSVHDNVKNHEQESVTFNAAEETRVSLTDCNLPKEEQQQPIHHQLRHEGEIIGSWSSQEAPSTSSTGIPTKVHGLETTPSESVDSCGAATKIRPSHDPPETKSPVPLGLGLGSLQPMRRSRQVRSEGRNVGGASHVEPANGNQQSISAGQQVLQSLVSRGSNATGDANAPTRRVNPVFGQNMPIGTQDSNSHFDVASMMSQVLNSPALNGLLAGVSEQAGIGSPDSLRNMLEQFTQSPTMRNTVNQIVQQIDDQELSSISGVRSQGGGLDMSRMVQQMMPIVSQALTRTPTVCEPSYGLESGEHRQSDLNEPPRLDQSNQCSQIDLQQVSQSIERNDPPGEIFRIVAEHAASLCGEGDSQDLIGELCRDEDLANEFMEMLQRGRHQ